MNGTKAKLNDILDGIDFVSAGNLVEHEAYLSKITGEVHWVSEDLDEDLPEDVGNPEKYIALPHKNALDLGKALVLEFVAEVLPDSVGRVRGFFSRPGAYGSFKLFLERRGKLQEWYAYEKKAAEAAARAWCKENGIEVDG